MSTLFFVVVTKNVKLYILYHTNSKNCQMFRIKCVGRTTIDTRRDFLTIDITRLLSVRTTQNLKNWEISAL